MTDALQGELTAAVHRRLADVYAVSGSSSCPGSTACWARMVSAVARIRVSRRCSARVEARRMASSSCAISSSTRSAYSQTPRLSVDRKISCLGVHCGFGSQRQEDFLSVSDLHKSGTV